ncbi:maleylpyruvate isomerase family mycothiol-dependent enzyme [Mycobacterium sp. TY815]|uniref:maleylpyruvate isomerase family mycothiol-dependent enzyme n=1 Tax=Mycobacterium sp. TY815 TaxID=3050581 RepID=UPI00274045CB|nr:maleylpyruvate isomerase family mycothiol-dependent enzyme [Mycobacterium sp. TY815]MDP7701832.1 maleylpyruvate isomerase family mycothiol-dependent enzyme [Mycobacterium sp. TY815]
MHSADYLHALRRDGERIAAVAGAGLHRGVPSCTGWTIAELVWHVGNVHTFWRQVAAGVVAGPKSYREPARPDEQSLVQWFRDGLQETVTTLSRIHPEAPAWTWGHRQNVGFVQRRLAHETAIHCWDAVVALGRDEAVEPRLAADGVAEFLEEVLPGMSRDLDGPVQSIRLQCNDIDGEWTVRAGSGACRLVPDGHVDVTVRATASDLVLLLWGRRPLERLRVDGDAGALRRFLARGAF